MKKVNSFTVQLVFVCQLKLTDVEGRGVHRETVSVKGDSNLLVQGWLEATEATNLI